MSRAPDTTTSPNLPLLLGRGRGRELARDLAGTPRLTAASRATRRADLSSLLAYTCQRRLARAHRSGTEATEFPARAHRPSAGNSAEHRATRAAAEGPAPRLVERLDVAPGLLRLNVSRPPDFRYRPGQHVKLGVPGLTRTYSLASAPHEPHLEFFIELFPGGSLSQRLRSLEPGAAMALADRAKGKLAVDEGFSTQFLIATVTGIAPYVSFLRDHLHQSTAIGRRRFVVLHGASHADELGYADELGELARRHPGTVTYLPTVSRADDPRNRGWDGLRGRVETHVEALIARFHMSPRDTAVFACGNPQMVKNVADGARRGGFTVHTEPFD